jgi:hypothetical protein
MDHFYLCAEFDKKKFMANRYPDSSLDTRRADTHEWVQHDLDLTKVLSENMLVNEMVNRKIDKGGGQVERVCIYLCYNWKLKTEFVLVRITLATTRSEYTPQYGRDNNYSDFTRCDTQFLGFSVEAFKRERPDLAMCLDAV